MPAYVQIRAYVLRWEIEIRIAACRVDITADVLGEYAPRLGSMRHSAPTVGRQHEGRREGEAHDRRTRWPRVERHMELQGGRILPLLIAEALRDCLALFGFPGDAVVTCLAMHVLGSFVTVLSRCMTFGDGPARPA